MFASSTLDPRPARPVRRPRLWFLLWLLLSMALGSAALGSERTSSTPRPWVLCDGPLWDISDEGLPYRCTLAWPATVDPLAAFTQARDARWTASLGYASAYDNLDTGTGRITDRGRDGPMLNVGRQLVWPLPWAPASSALGFELELGLNYAACRLPADGTRLSFSLFAGLEWQSAPRAAHGWLVGVRWFHLSHGGLFGPNGGYDGLVFRLGRRWAW